MATFEATGVILSKINNLDPQNASKIIGYILVNLDDTEILRLASAPDSILHNIVLKVKSHLCLSSPSPSSSSSAPSPSNLIPRHPSNPFSRFNPSWNNPISPKVSPLLSPNNTLSGFVPKSYLSINEDEQQLGSDYFSFLNESPTKNEDSVDPRVEFEPGHSVVNNGDSHFHRRSFSASDAYFGSEETGYKPCMYFARGFCKNGSNCKFVHGGFADSVDNNNMEEILRFKALQNQRLMAGASSPSPYDKYIDLLMQHRAAGVMTGNEFHKFNRRNDFLAMVSAEKPNSPSRQIYLTFPAECTFKDEDVSEYFSKFGPVQDVRIPYQQKRMFGFVTFVYSETVRLILSKGNPHFICDSRVLVKPYKEKGKAPDKRQQQKLERAEFSPCLSPSGPETNDFHLGARMFYNPRELVLRRNIEEQAELQQAIELHQRRLMDLQLPDFKNNHMRNHHRSLSVGASLPLPQFHSHISNPALSFDSIKEDNTGFRGNLASTFSSAEQRLPQADNDSGNLEDSAEEDILDLCNSFEQGLLDSPSASPDDQTRPSTLPEGKESAPFSINLACLDRLELKTDSDDASPH